MNFPATVNLAIIELICMETIFQLIAFHQLLLAPFPSFKFTAEIVSVMQLQQRRKQDVTESKGS